MFWMYSSLNCLLASSSSTGGFNVDIAPVIDWKFHNKNTRTIHTKCYVNDEKLTNLKNWYLKQDCPQQTLLQLTYTQKVIWLAHQSSKTEHKNLLHKHAKNNNRTKWYCFIIHTAHVNISTNCYTISHTHTRLTALFPELPRWASIRR